MNRKIPNEELGRMSVEDFAQSEKTPIVVVLDNIRSLNNVGSVFRTADAMAIEAIYLCGITAQPPHREINKTALGATDTIPWKYYENTLNALEELKSNGFLLLSIEQAEKKTFLKTFQPLTNQKYAVIFGHEVKGVSQEVIDLSDEVIEIEQFGTKHSLNISVSTGIVLYNLVHKIKAL